MNTLRVGQSKLEPEHRRARLERHDAAGQEAATMNVLKPLIDSRRSTSLRDADPGEWSGMPVRNMANEPDCVDFCTTSTPQFGG